MERKIRTGLLILLGLNIGLVYGQEPSAQRADISVQDAQKAAINTEQKKQQGSDHKAETAALKAEQTSQTTNHKVESTALNTEQKEQDSDHKAEAALNSQDPNKAENTALNPEQNKQASDTKTETTPLKTEQNQVADQKNEIGFGQIYKPQAKQTLEDIAKKLVNNTEFSITQVITAIAVKNPESLKENAQQLKEAATLNLPTQDEVKLISHALLMNYAMATHSDKAKANGTQNATEPAPLPGASSTTSTDTSTSTTSAASTSTTTTDSKDAAATTEVTKTETSIETTTSTETPLPLPIGKLPKPKTPQELMNAVIAQNGGYSTSPLFPCGDEDKFCFSGLLDLEGRYYDHHGNPGFFISQGSFDQSTLGGVGVRAPFGYSSRTVTGSINNANAFFDLKLPPIAKIHTNLAYVNGSVVLNSYTWEYGADWGSVYRLPAALKVDELYLVLGNGDLLPVYIKIGRMYSDFGDYDPNGYGIATIVPSLTQLMTQSRTGAGQLGIVLPAGFYGSLSMSYAQNSYSMDNRPAEPIIPKGIGPNKRNFSGKLGYKGPISVMETDVNVSFIADLRDVDYLNDSLWFIATFENEPFVGFGNHIINKQGGLAYHADFYYCPFGITFEGMYSSGKLNPGTDTPPGTWDSHIRTGGVEGRVDFKTFDHISQFKLAYQWARHTQVIAGSIFGNRPTFHNMLPRSRWQGTYAINLIEHFNIGLQWVHDHDFDEPRNGMDISSNIAVVRIDVEF